MRPFHTSIPTALEALKQASPPLPFVTMLQHGSMTVEYYAPVGVDKQTPHKKDELYVIAKGSGMFNRDGVTTPIDAGDVLFVPAGMQHSFEDFTNDFATWVIFYGPDGGEEI